MEDYKSMQYYTLKAECKKLGLDSKGNRETLLERLGVTDLTKEPEAPEAEVTAPAPEKEAPVEMVEEKVKAKPAETPAILAATPEELNRYLPDAKLIQPVDTSKYDAWLTPERLQKLENRIAPIAAGKGTYRFDIDHPGSAFQVEFKGKGPVLESTTLIDTDDQIVRRAQVYFTSRLVIGKNGAQSGI